MSAEPAEPIESTEAPPTATPEPPKESQPSAANKYSTFIIPVIILIILVAGVGYFAATQSGMDKAAVESVLTQWSEQIKEATSKDGNQPIAFSYGSVEMAGNGTERHAVIVGPTFATKVGEDEEDVLLTTAQARVYPTSVSFDEMKIVLDLPLSIRASGVEVGRISYAEPITIDTQLTTEDEREYVNTQFAVPSALTIESLPEQKTLNVTMDAGASFQAKLASDGSGLGSSTVNASNIVVKGADEAEISVGKLALDFSDMLGKNDMHDLAVVADIRDARWPEEKELYGAVSINADLKYRGPLPKDDEMLDFSAAGMTLDVSQLQIKNANAYMSVKGKVQGADKELLPIGKMQLKVGNFGFVRDELRNQGGISEEEWPLVGALFERITGQKLDEAKDVDIEMSRVAQGSLQIGAITFEEALAIVLTGGKLLPKQTGSEAKPEEAQPAIAPEAIDTEKVKG